MAQSYENLNIWKDSVDFAKEIYKVTVNFPKTEVFGITSQVRRAVVSVSTNIAEGSGRNSKKDFSRFIDISIGSLNETESLLHISNGLGYLKVEDFKRLNDVIKRLGVSIGAFKKYLNK